MIERFIKWLENLFKWDTELPPEVLQKPVQAPVSPVKPVAAESPVITPKSPQMTNSQKFYNTALASLHKDMSPNDLAPDSLACMESVDGVYTATFGEHLLSMPARLSTQAAYEAMLRDPRLEAIIDPIPGDIVISPTGHSTKGAQHGHTGCWGKNDVLSNDSNTGLWSDNYTHEAWYSVFNKTLGFPVYFFRIK